MFSPHALNTEQQKLRIKSAVIGPSWTEIRITLCSEKGRKLLYFHLSTLLLLFIIINLFEFKKSKSVLMSM